MALCGCACRADDGAKFGSHALSGLRQRCEAVAKLQQRVSAATPETVSDVAADCLRELENLSVRESDPGGSFCAYYRARLLALAGRRAEARDGYFRLARTPSVCPESLSDLIGLVRLGQGKAEDELFYSDLLGAVVPIGVFGSCSDARRGGPQEWGADAPAIPMPNRKRLAKIAAEFDAMRMDEDAADKWVEAVYAESIGPEVGAVGNAWLVGGAAAMWLGAAEARWQTGCTDVACDYIAKAMVFGSDTDRRDGAGLLGRLSDPNASGRRVAKPDRDRLLAIVELYVLLQMHPCAVRILDRHAGMLGPDSKTLRATCESEWLDLVQRYAAARGGKAFLFGQDVSAPASRLAVSIPPPCTPEAVRQASERLAGRVRAVGTAPVAEGRSR